MTPELIQRLIKLVQTHGDRVVLADPAMGRAVVVLDLEEYERFRDGAANTASAPARTVAPTPAPTPTPATPAEPALMAKKAAQPREKTPSNLPTDPDLTQEELIDKINRDIGAWKTAQDRKRTDELKSAARPQATPPVREVPAPAPRIEVPSALEDEERFFLEPIE